ncbi:peptide ABC transporter substrate-binding protein [Microlunatus parietis]|uniref:Peptide/nickel transport system substrate-binding protein/oligopeptide transport system substrate-binding protein n=1 Tax=Microlunatus parietis TaxID=682979 RepID=A0A7Y9I7A3_9ACTN|nr:peptide ABC transporter substrate-binding protein [Microlunatus parietis]NYE71365.1 peptide/nickel transport system substrate-binding protein/oligopeptide transport system substrate-binding protein [Microlunatus parietis]
METSVSPGGLAKVPANRRDFLRLSGALGIAATGTWSLTGCNIFGSQPQQQEGAKTLRIAYTTVETVDPQVITNGMWILTRGILEGLVTQTETGDSVNPATAESWEISDDNLTYTFKLRENAKWSNGDPVTAHDFEATYKRLFTPSGASAGGTTLGANSYQASTGIKGAVEFLSGALTDWSQVGVKATGDKELVITLANPNPDLLPALSHPSLLPLHMKTVEEKPDDWQKPPNFITNGPYAVTNWVMNSTLDLVPNENYWDRGQVFYDNIQVQLIEATASGTQTVPYENNETDIVGIPDVDVQRFQKDPELSKHLKVVENYSVAYLAKLRSENPALEDIRVRQALSMAMSRDTLAGVVTGAKAGQTLVPGRVKGWDDSFALGEDIEQAKRLLAEAGYPDGKGLPEIRILAGVDSPIVAALADVWQKNLGIKVRPDIVESGVYVERRWQVQKGDYIGFYFGTFAGLPTWPTYTGSLWSPIDVQKFSLPSASWAQYQKIEQDKELDAGTKNKQLAALLKEKSSPGSREMADLVAKGYSEPDDAKRLAIFKEAAGVREQESLYIPVLWLSVYFAVRPTIEGIVMRAYPDYFYLKGLKPKA